MTGRLVSGSLVVALFAATAADAQGGAATLTPPDGRGEAVDFSLEETSGSTRTLAEARGRIVVLFYEDREHTEDNVELKRELHVYVSDNHLEDRVRVYAVADVHAIPGPIRDMARGIIRAIASEYGIQILLDWEGTLLAAPFSMAEGAANVALLDTSGRFAWRSTGALDATGESAFYRALRQLLRE